MERWYSSNPIVSQILDDWFSICQLAKREVKLKKEESKKTVWELVERLAPIYSRSYEGNEWIIVRVIYNKVERKKYIDVRIYKKVENNFEKTDKGIYVSVENWDKLLLMIAKLLTKYIN